MIVTPARDSIHHLARVAVSGGDKADLPVDASHQAGSAATKRGGALGRQEVERGGVVEQRQQLADGGVRDGSVLHRRPLQRFLPHLPPRLRFQDLDLSMTVIFVGVGGSSVLHQRALQHLVLHLPLRLFLVESCTCRHGYSWLNYPHICPHILSTGGCRAWRRSALHGDLRTS